MLCWNRTEQRAHQLAELLSVEGVAAIAVPDLESSVCSADIVTACTRASAAITAALSASAELEEVLSDGRQRYAESFLAALERFASPPEDQAIQFFRMIVNQGRS